MSSTTTFQVELGIVGALISLVGTYGLPVGVSLAQGKTHLRKLTIDRLVGFVIIFACTLFLGVAAALLVGSSDGKAEIAAGAAGQSVIAGFTKKLTG